VIFLGETFFEEKGFPEPLPKTFSNREKVLVLFIFLVFPAGILLCRNIRF